MTRSRDIADQQKNIGGAVAPFVAGKNFVIGGGFDNWQRGTSVATTAGGTNYTADRWAAWSQGPVMTTSRQATSDTTNLPFIQYCARVQRNSGQTSVGAVVFETMIETVNTIPLVGKVVTVSFYARAGANFSASSSILNWGFVTGTGTDQNQITGYTGQAVPISAAPSLTTTWQRFTGTGTIATNVNEATVQFYYIPTGTASTNDYVEITGVQVEIGSAATPFARAGGSIGGELALCQRYFETQDWTINTFRLAVVYASNGPGQGYFTFTPKRVAPSYSWSTNGSARYIYQNGQAIGSQTLTASFGSYNGASFATSTSVPATTGWVDNAGTLSISAEL